MMFTVGYIYGNKNLTREDRLFIALARAKGARLATMSSMRFMPPAMIRNKALKCDVIFNGSADTVAVEMAKIAEQAGVTVLDSTQSLYYCEDKMMFAALCMQHGIPSPKTYLLPLPIHKCREPIRRLIKESGAVVIKNVLSDNGTFVSRAKTVEQALTLVKRFRKRDAAPLIAQEYIDTSRCVYRVTVLNGKVLQGVVKKSHHWKCTGEFVHGDAPVFPVPPELAVMCIKIAEVTNLPLCGIDLMRKGETWIAIEANSCPAMDFIQQDMKRLYEHLIAYLFHIARKKKEDTREAYSAALGEENLPPPAFVRAYPKKIL